MRESRFIYFSFVKTKYEAWIAKMQARDPASARTLSAEAIYLVAANHSQNRSHSRRRISIAEALEWKTLQKRLKQMPRLQIPNSLAVLEE
jgi:hypothetical protein